MAHTWFRTRWPCLIASPPAESPFAQGEDFTDEFTEKEDLLDELGSGVAEFEDEGDFDYATEATDLRAEDCDSDALDQLTSTPSTNYF
ncbi:hypothetical protein DAPPUDRAFT_265983 [Daphnia pulex]|uniref:Uncharacterized protein n=1 Tax=Daphnia pulex TaxID=6669 RepID=E9HUB6_DAPPU|nr:hypothetical protein DAPPUDRAFT_265983 [Daphnia pulex]|eukprot:EFX64660.1 hypothetical protein DAPPUDRAFT_265983 [Daphnia pulex]